MKKSFLILAAGMFLLTACYSPKEDGIRLSDGTKVETARDHTTSVYRLADGTELLRVRDTIGPENVKSNDTDGLTELNEEARKAILKFYESQELLYDIDARLEAAYKDYQSNPDKFQPESLGQTVQPSESNDEMIFFMTTADTPDFTYIGNAFKRETGEPVNNYELFNCEPEEIVEKVCGISGKVSDERKAAMEEALKPEYIVFYPGQLEIMFPKGVLPETEQMTGVAVKYEELGELLKEWAVPEE